jgi:hypothetical protein
MPCAPHAGHMYKPVPPSLDSVLKLALLTGA